jgi:hypothetical protein
MRAAIYGVTLTNIDLPLSAAAFWIRFLVHKPRHAFVSPVPTTKLMGTIMRAITHNTTCSRLKSGSEN